MHGRTWYKRIFVIANLLRPATAQGKGMRNQPWGVSGGYKKTRALMPAKCGSRLGCRPVRYVLKHIRTLPVNVVVDVHQLIFMCWYVEAWKFSHDRNVHQSAPIKPEHQFPQSPEAALAKFRICGQSVGILQLLDPEPGRKALLDLAGRHGKRWSLHGGLCIVQRHQETAGLCGQQTGQVVHVVTTLGVGQ